MHVLVKRLLNLLQEAHVLLVYAKIGTCLLVDQPVGLAHVLVEELTQTEQILNLHVQLLNGERLLQIHVGTTLHALNLGLYCGLGGEQD